MSDRLIEFDKRSFLKSKVSLQGGRLKVVEAYKMDEITDVAVEMWTHPGGWSKATWLVRVSWCEIAHRRGNISWMFPEGVGGYEAALTMFEAAEPGMQMFGDWYKELKRVAV